MHLTHAVSRRPETFRDRAVVTRCRRIAKRSLDVVASLLALLVLALPMLAVAVLIRLTSTGPALFRQTRVGRHGRTFVILKFRTMRAGSSDAAHREYIARMLTGQVDCVDGLYKLDHDLRVTRVGAVLRRCSLDELPQLINVLRGEMSLVGPRPALPWELEMFPDTAGPRFDVPPGLTGLWQVSGRNRLTMLQGLELDVEYVAHQSIWGDIKILARTVPALLRGDAR